jgi:hypoxanthine phosphoribosyltransferase
MKFTWSEARQGVAELAKELKELERWEDIQYVLLGRGGLQVGALLAREIKMRRIFYIPIDNRTLNPVHWSFLLYVNSNLPVVLVDDIYDTGRTLQAVFDEVESEVAHHAEYPIRCIALMSRYGKGKQINLRHWKTLLTDEWIEFPWEEGEVDQQKELPF